MYLEISSGDWKDESSHFIEYWIEELFGKPQCHLTALRCQRWGGILTSAPKQNMKCPAWLFLLPGASWNEVLWGNHRAPQWKPRLQQRVSVNLVPYAISELWSAFWVWYLPKILYRCILLRTSMLAPLKDKSGLDRVMENRSSRVMVIKGNLYIHRL